MKKYFLSALLLIFFSTSMFFSCQNDEAEMEPQSKIELLKAKSQEFAKKYGVGVTLNEDYLAKHADEMTVEGMEADYKAFAELKNNAQHKDTLILRKKTLSKKSFFARRKVETETMTPDMLDNDGVISSSGTLSKNCCGSFVAYNAIASWESNNGTIKAKLDKLVLSCHGMKCSEVDENSNIKSENCEGSYTGGPWINVFSGAVTKDGAYFSVSYKVPSIKLCMYTISNISVQISCSGKVGRINVSL